METSSTVSSSEQEEYEEINAFCNSVKMLWFASPWDEASVDFLEGFRTPVYKNRFRITDRRSAAAPYPCHWKADYSFQPE